MPRSLLPLLLAVLAACAPGDAPDEGAVPADTSAAASDSLEAARVVLVSGPLRIEPSPAADGVADAAAGTALRLLADTTVGSGRWVRLATWDDRAGWMPASAVMEPGLWTHYMRALGGVPPSATRPAYPVADGRWVAEKPFPSPDFDPPAAVRLAGDSMVATRVVARDTVSAGCAGKRFSMARLEGGLPGAIPDRGSFLSRGVLAIPTETPPTAEPLALGPLAPEPALLQAVAAAADRALAAGPDPGLVPDADVPPAPEPRTGPRIDWQAAGPDAAWAVASWDPYDEASVLPGRWSAAFVAVREGGRWSVRAALPLQWTTAGGERAAWRLLSALATIPGRPTLLAVEALAYEGARVDLYLADDVGYRRYYRGYDWGC